MHTVSRSFAILMLSTLALSALAAAEENVSKAADVSPPVSMTAEEDHQRMMKLLGIEALRPGANGRDANAPNAANYDESKANPFPELPDPLTLNDGSKVTTPRAWWQQRRGEIVEAFEREVFGRMPSNTPKVAWEVKHRFSEKHGDVPVLRRELIGRVDNSDYPLVNVDIHLSLTTPSTAKGPVPVIMELQYKFPPSADPALLERVRATSHAWQQLVLAKGWGFAVYIPTSVQPDNGAGLTQGIIGLVNKGKPRSLDDWGALRAWGWGASRALDYLVTDPAVDASKVGIAGHSRYGKAALVTMADDPRFAIGYISSSGAGGAKLHRRNFGEIVENVAGSGEYHWMAGNYIKYAGPLTWKDLPVDSHQLIALSAPRPIFIGAGATEGDGWVDAKGMFMAAVHAGSVYKLLGKSDLGTTEFPPIGTALVNGDLAFRQHTEGHTAGPNWSTFLTFASRYFD